MNSSNKISSDNSAKEAAFAGAASGFVSRALIQPLDVLKIRLQLQVEPLTKKLGKYHGVIPTTICIYKEEGLKALWKGHMCGQIHAISFSMIQFYSYAYLIEKYNRTLIRKSSVSERLFSNFICGSLSGTVAIASTQPLDILRTRFVAQGEPRLYNSLYSATRTIVKNEGFATLYRGLLPNILLISSQCGLQFLFYNVSNSLIGFLFSLIDRSTDSLRTGTELRNIGFIQSIASGGVAGALAKMTVFPLDIVKKRMQVQGFEEARKKFGKLHKSNGFIRCFGVIYREEGLTAFTKGLKPVFRTGSMIVTGITVEDQARVSTRKIARIIMKAGYTVTISNFKIVNVCGVTDTKRPVNLYRFQQRHSDFCSFEPELFPALVYRLLEPKMTAIVFQNGKVNVVGAKSTALMNEGFEKFFVVLTEFWK